MRRGVKKVFEDRTFRPAIQGFKPQLSRVAMPSQFIYVFRRKLRAITRLNPRYFRFPRRIRYNRRRRIGMFLTKQNLAMARTLGVAIVAAVGLGGCATYKEEFATI